MCAHTWCEPLPSVQVARSGSNAHPCPGAQVRQPETVEVANFLLDRMGRGAVSAELLQPDELVAAIIAQVAAEPAMGNLLSGFIYAANGVPLPQGGREGLG